MAELIISVSGLRGIVGETLTPEVAGRFAAAFASVIPPGDVLISRDSRPTGAMLSAAVAASLMASGRNVRDAGIAATPTTGVLVREYGCAGGIQISASHNPSEYNGIKLFNAQGRVIPAVQGEEVLRAYRSQNTHWVSHAQVGQLQTIAQTYQKHCELVLQRVNVAKIQQQKFRVLLDGNHGAGSVLGLPLLQALGCEVVCLGAEPHGKFAHIPEPTAHNLRDVTKQVRDNQCVIGFCQDPDADRLAIIDEQGNYIGEEYTLALCLDHVLAKQAGCVVTNCSSSRMSQDIAAKYGVPCILSAVGEANVVDCMLQHNAVFGGEGNGGPIDPAVGLVRDSFIGMALILEMLAERHRSVSQLVQELPHYEIQKDKVALSREQIAPAMEALAKKHPAAKASRMDGLRLDWPKSWLIVRASNTEPIVRIIAEASTSEEAQELCQSAAEVLQAAQ